MAAASYGTVLQWIIIGTVGIILGIYTLGVSALPPKWAPLFILAVLCPFIAMVVGNVRRLVLAIMILEIPFQLDFNLGYRDDTITGLNARGGLSISVTTIALIILYALWLGEALGRIKRQAYPRIWTSTTLSLAAYLAFAILSVVVARDVMLSIYEIFLLVSMFLLYIYIIATVRTRQDVLFIVTMLLIGLLLESLIMIGLRFVGHSITVAGLVARIDGGIRVAGTMGSPNTAASYLILFLALAVGILLTQLGRPHKWLAALTFGLGGVALILTLSRGGWVAFGLSMAILCLFVWIRGGISGLVPMAVVFGVLLISLLFQDSITARFFSEEASSPETRIYMIKLAFKIIQDNPILGVGVNNYALYIDQYATPDFGGGWLHVVHNKYLLVLAETGIGGLAAFLFFLGATIRRGWQCWKLDDHFLSPLAISLTVGVVGQMAQMLLIMGQGRAQLQSLWLVASLIAAMSNISTMDTNKSTSNRCIIR